MSTCIVIAKNKYMQTATNYYLFNLAMADLLLLVLGLPLETYQFWSAYPWVFGDIFCVIRTMAAETSTYASILTITAFTIERYMRLETEGRSRGGPRVQAGVSPGAEPGVDLEAAGAKSRGGSRPDLGVAPRIHEEIPGWVQGGTRGDRGCLESNGSWMPALRLVNSSWVAPEPESTHGNHWCNQV